LNGLTCFSVVLTLTLLCGYTTKVSEARAIGQVREADLSKSKASVETLMQAKRELEQQLDACKDEINQLEVQAETSAVSNVYV
jgi:TolA-binding protein